MIDVLPAHVTTRLRQTATYSTLTHKHAAVLLDARNNPICFGRNKLIGPVDSPKSISIHAEVDAIMKYVRAYRPRGRKASKLAVIRLSGRNGMNGFGCSKPCEACAKVIDAYDLTVLHS